MAGDEFHGRLVGFGGGDVGSGDFGGILTGEQRGVGSSEGEAGGSGLEGGGHAVGEPLGGVVEGGVAGEFVAGKSGFIIAVEGGDEEGASLVGVFGDAADEGDHLGSGGDDELLSGLQVQADVDGYARETVELFFEGESGEGGGGDGGGGRHEIRVNRLSYARRDTDLG